MAAPKNTTNYLKGLPTEQREALETVRKRIIAAAPGVEEHFGYGLPGFKLDGHPLIYFGAAKNHCAIYGSVPAGFADALKDFKMSKGTIQFTPEKPIPATLLKELVKARVAENRLRWPLKAKKTASKKK